MKEIKLQFETYELPENWEELSLLGSRFQTPLKLCLVGEKELDRNGWELLVRIMLDVPQRAWESLQLSIDQWVYLQNECKWVFKEPLLLRPVKYIIIDSSEFEVVDLSKATAVEMAMGLVYFTQYGGGDQEAADWMLAVFCRKKGLDYSADVTAETAKMMANADEWTKMVLVKYVTDFLAAFIEEYSDMFGEGGKPIYEHGEGWYYMLGNAVKAGYYKSLVDVSQANAAEVWGWMRNDTLEAARSVAKNK